MTEIRPDDDGAQLPSSVRLHHVIDDIERRRTALLRAARASILLLEDARHALSAGRLEVVDEFLDRSIDGLRKAATEQETTR